MSSANKGVSKHYTTHDLGNRILTALKAAGSDLDALTVDDLAPVDEFHIRGRTATEELAQWAEVQPAHRLLEDWKPVGLHLLMGNNAAAKFGNVLRNLEEDRVRVVQAVMKRAGSV